MAYDPWPNTTKRQTGRKTENKRFIGEPPAPPSHFAENERAIWRDIVRDPRFFGPTAAALAALCIALEAHVIARHAADEIAKIERKGNSPPRRLYELQSRAIKSYVVAMRDVLGLP
jgi:hypothetical protein